MPLIQHKDAGQPLTLLNNSEYETWLAAQSTHTQNWITATQFKGEGLCLIPSQDAQLASAVFVSKKLNDFFTCGELVNQLPCGEYQAQTQDEALLFSLAVSWGLSAYQFDRYKANPKTYPVLNLANADLVKRAQAFLDGICLTRDLINTPASDMMPQHLAEQTQALATRFGAEFNEIVGDDLLTQNYPTIHAVGRASVHAPRLLDLHWGDKKHPKVTLVGKGVCFDSGGLDLKPSTAMRYMKKDMGGSAHVLGLASMVMALNLPVQLRVLIPAVENAVAGNAFRPGDILTTRKGLTVEIDNTDAEGRLVLCDALDEACNDAPEVIIDFATLTGACRVALGTELPGFFCNNQDVANGLMTSSATAQDPIWQLPLHDAYRDMLKSDIADMVNSVPSPFGGAITAALYLQESIRDDIPWVHFDVMAWNNRKLPGRPVGGEAMGLRAVLDYLENRFA